MSLLNPVLGLPVKLLTLTTANDVNLFSAAGSPPYPIDLRVTIASANWLWASSVGVYGLTVGSFASGSRITIINNGYIVGCGAAGGIGGGVICGLGSVANGSAGNVRGPALLVSSMSNVSVRIDNTSGQINGGGGGGGGGGGAGGDFGGQNSNGAGGGGGGGGQSYQTSAGASGGAVGDCVFSSSGGSGNNGGSGNLGAGAAGGTTPFTAGGAGGNGGTWGVAGATGGNGGGGSNGSGAGGGAGGAAVVGNSNITWIAVGTRNGAIT